MEFKEWLNLQEKFKGLKRIFQQQNPQMPRYVQNDLYNTRIAHTMSKLINNQSVPNNSSPVPSDSATKIFKSSNFQNSQWNKVPEILTWRGQEGVTPASFTPKTQSYFTHRLFGFKEEKFIRNDSQRMNTQNSIMQKRGEGANEPVIVNLTMQGYELLEGWHRTMNYLLRGAPPDQLNSLRNGNIRNLDYSQWYPIKIKAYVGKGPEIQHALAGTGKMEED